MAPPSTACSAGSPPSSPAPRAAPPTWRQRPRRLHYMNAAQAGCEDGWGVGRSADIVVFTAERMSTAVMFPAAAAFRATACIVTCVQSVINSTWPWRQEAERAPRGLPSRLAIICILNGAEHLSASGPPSATRCHTCGGARGALWRCAKQAVKFLLYPSHLCRGGEGMQQERPSVVRCHTCGGERHAGARARAMHSSVCEACCQATVSSVHGGHGSTPVIGTAHQGAGIGLVQRRQQRRALVGIRLLQSKERWRD